MKHLILGDDPQLRLFGEAVVWLKKTETFRKGEDERMFTAHPSAEVDLLAASLMDAVPNFATDLGPRH